jgi:hypothetical protein
MAVIESSLQNMVQTANRVEEIAKEAEDHHFAVSTSHISLGACFSGSRAFASLRTLSTDEHKPACMWAPCHDRWRSR